MALQHTCSYLDIYSAWRRLFKKPKHVADNYLNWWLIKVVYRLCWLLFYLLVYLHFLQNTHCKISPCSSKSFTIYNFFYCSTFERMLKERYRTRNDDEWGSLNVVFKWKTDVKKKQTSFLPTLITLAWNDG
jgi:hypothetical protein